MGLIVSGGIFTTWLVSLLGVLPLDLTICSLTELMLLILLRTFLHTGLFVIAHDAMHGNALPTYPVGNRWLGQLALGLYGFLPYKTACRLHWQHHIYPAQARDPDFCEKSEEDWILYAVRWYCKFMRNYLTRRNMMGIVAGVSLTIFCLGFVGHIAVQNIILFWMVPWILSSIQLFVFGTFLPHFSSDHSNKPHQARSFYYPPLFSLLICYHFSYHREHHTHPQVPWYLLPNIALPNCPQKLID